MNKLRGQIEGIEVSGSLSIVSVNIQGCVTLNVVVIETPETADYLQTGYGIYVLFKETEVIIGRDVVHPISLQNRIPGVIQQIEGGKLLSKILVQTPIGGVTAIISTNAVRQLNLKEGTKVVVMVKINEIMLSV